VTTFPGVPLGKLSSSIQYGISAQATQIPTIARYLRITDVDDYGNFVTKNPVFADASSADLEKYRVEVGDLLIARSGVSAGRAFVVPEGFDDWVFASYFIRFKIVKAVVLPEYVAAYCRSPFYWKQIGRIARGAAQPNVNSQELAGIQIPLPPPREQRRIVEVLKEAEQIRRLRAQAETKTAQLIPSIFHRHFVNGATWNKKLLLDFADVVSGVAIGREIRGGGVREVPYIRVANVQAGYLDLSELKLTRASESEVMAFALQKGDILLTEGGDFDKLGRGCLWHGDIAPCIHQNHVFRVRPDPSRLNSVFFTHFLQSASAKGYFLRCSKRTTNLASINLTQLKNLPVPEVPIDLQNAFQVEIETAEACSVSATHRTEQALISSLLAHAFTGELTAKWRERHRKTLEQEARERDDILKATGAYVSLKPSESDSAKVFTRITDGAYAELTREQHTVLEEACRGFGGVKFPRWFTAEQVAERLRGPLHKNAHAVEAHLTVLVARGLVIAVSREEEHPETGATIYGNAYSLPLNEMEATLGDDQGNKIVTESGAGISVGTVPGDKARLREMQRLADRLKTSRTT
jgi:type I restriction enzyme, S subunit